MKYNNESLFSFLINPKYVSCASTHRNFFLILNYEIFEYIFQIRIFSIVNAVLLEKCNCVVVNRKLGVSIKGLFNCFRIGR